MPAKKSEREEFTSETKKQAWENAPKIMGKNPDRYRETADGEKAHLTLTGRQINFHFDHKNPCENGGTNSLRNCELLSPFANLQKGTKQNKY